MQAIPVVSVIVVSFGGQDLLRRCLASIPDSVSSGAVQTIVVDNASPDGTPDMVEREFPRVRLVRATSNAGFAAGNNRGLAVSAGRYVMLLNPDAELMPGCLEACLNRLEQSHGIAVIAPRLQNPDGSLQCSLRNFPTASNAVFEALMLQRLFPRATPRFAEMIVDPAFYDAEREVEWASGAAFVTRASVFRRIGGLDERYFLFSEETDWFLRLAQSGMRCVYLPHARVIHRSSEGRNPRLMHDAVHSRLLYARKNLSPGSAAVIRVVLGLGMAARLAAWALLSLAGGASAKARWEAYRVGLATVVTFGRTEGVARA